MTLSTDQNPAKPKLAGLSLQFLTLRGPIMARWERETRSRVEGADALLSPVLTNTLPAFLENLAEALSSAHPRTHATSNTNAAAVHGGERARMTNFGPDQLIHEYQILRESIAVEVKDTLALTASDWAIIDGSINSAVREAVREFASQQDELRRRLAAALSHDMRTPLAVIANGATLIQMTPDAEQGKRAAAKISSSAHRLGHMMGELLDALTVHGGQKLPLVVTEFDIQELIHEVCREYALSAGVDITAESEHITGHWCKNTLRRALENLINNARKYGDLSKIFVRGQHTHGRLMLSVHNSGNPIPEPLFERIFEYGTQAADTDRAHGWGLGLPFVKRVAAAHGGSVTVDSSLATGTTFLIDIPLDCRPFATVNN